jgi:2-desacetyl-2-hydroxyethyl bacteriochlorophyllide A dehydrogenase
MRAARLHEVGAPLRIDEVPEPTTRYGEVLVRIAYCGVCASDLHVKEGVTPSGPLPQTLGHEAAGRLVTDAEGFRAGQWVAVLPGRWCGTCDACSAGRQNLCREGRFLGVDIDGAFTQVLSVPPEAVIRVPEGVDPAHAAVASDAVATAFHALRRGGDLEGLRVAVYGAGGVGAHAVMLAKPLGAEWVAVVDADPVARERALGFGADEAVDPADGKPARAIRGLVDGGADVALEFIGNVETMSQAVKSLRPGGRAVLVGLTPEELRLLPAAVLVASELEVVGSFGAPRAEVEELFEMLGRGDLDLSRSITHRLPLDDADRALEMLRTREGHPLRIVLEID